MDKVVKKLSPISLSGFDIIQYFEELNDEVEWMAEGFMTDPSITMLYATDGIGKSLIGIQLALELCSCLPVFKTLQVNKYYKVIYVVAERSIKEPMKRIKKMIGDPDYSGKIQFENLVITTEFQGRDISNIVLQDALIESLRRHAKVMGGCDIIIFDPLYALVRGNLKDDQSISSVFGFFRRASVEFQANIMFFHHENRGRVEEGGTERTNQDYYGSKFISGLCTAVWHMKKNKGDHFNTFLECEKDTESSLIPKITLNYNPEFNTVCADIHSNTKAKEQIIHNFLKKHKESGIEFTSDQFFEETKIKVHPVSRRRIIARLIKDGFLVNKNKDGIEGKYSVISCNM